MMGALLGLALLAQVGPVQYCVQIDLLAQRPREIARESIRHAGYDVTSPHAIEVIDNSSGMMTVIAWIAHDTRVNEGRMMSVTEFEDLLVYAARDIMQKGDGWIYTPIQVASDGQAAENEFCGRGGG
jgi:hypothetical protein